jgi:hypothetical protein
MDVARLFSGSLEIKVATDPADELMEEIFGFEKFQLIEEVHPRRRNHLELVRRSSRPKVEVK